MTRTTVHRNKSIDQCHSYSYTKKRLCRPPHQSQSHSYYLQQHTMADSHNGTSERFCCVPALPCPSTQSMPMLHSLSVRVNHEKSATFLCIHQGFRTRHKSDPSPLLSHLIQSHRLTANHSRQRPRSRINKTSSMTSMTRSMSSCIHFHRQHTRTCQ
jgi:hypothetical protein